jgi:hypothetical protein
MVDQGADPVDDTVDEGLPEVGGVPFVELLRPNETALDRAVRRVIAQTAESEGNYAAFGNAP